MLFRSYFGQVSADYLIEGPIDSPNFVQFLRTHVSELELVFHNSDFRIYRIRVFSVSGGSALRVGARGNAGNFPVLLGWTRFGW